MSSIDKLTDSQLFQLLKENADQQAYAELYNRHNVLLYRRALRLTSDEEHARDLTQDVYMHLWEKRKTIDIHDGKLLAYLYRLIFHKSTRITLKTSNDHNYFDHLKATFSEGHNDTENRILLQELEESIASALQKMKPKVRDVFIQSRFEDKSHSVISQENNIPYNTVRDNIRKALQRLKIMGVGLRCFF
ncbi:sigma-70 family RNA polymerase sigma factor [Chitinophaga horti]|uniref:Sigma-70 family RNA polymerase sigma factor n=1 Tax=Chitinophaga horti TaxID=2920382 RepID=A0ABY6IXU1_9BACT|nr:sigma-70 family RNA polymerase sigma factor [Chitinophaga horti]UYQ92210.1 sigma-70 family RNA polymerase sigma factor [Chitinophaga horti]